MFIIESVCYFYFLLQITVPPILSKHQRDNQNVLLKTSACLIQVHLTVQSTLVISKSKGPSETLRDICTRTYQICRVDGNTNQTTIFHK